VVEAPKLLLDVLESWRKETMYADDDDYVFPSESSMVSSPVAAPCWSRTTFRPAAIKAGIITEKGGMTYDRDGEW